MKKKNKIEENEQGMTCHIEEPTEKAGHVMEAIMGAMRQADVKPSEVLPVLGEAVIEFLIAVANVSQVDATELVHVFGEGIYTAQLEVKKVKKGN